jgi:cytochrome c oxidase assembly protein subunit 15
MTTSDAVRRFRRLGLLTIFAVYFLILVGGIVRASGAGMGCPDWPTCFGQWVPPTDESQLPPNYQQIYADRGYDNTQFNPIKTWTEYLNRLTGVTIGFLIFLTAWSSRIFLKSDKTLFYLCLGLFFLVGFQGWLGAVVVASNLKPFMITLHMLLALLIVALLIYAIARSQKADLYQLETGSLTVKMLTALKLAMGITLIQVAMGTQVREAVDMIAHQINAPDRQLWRDQLPAIFYIHRAFSTLVLFLNLWISWKIIQATDTDSWLRKLALTLSVLVLSAILSGITLDRLSIPAFAQSIHLLIANLIFGMQFFLFISLKYAFESKAENR